MLLIRVNSSLIVPLLPAPYSFWGCFFCFCCLFVVVVYLREHTCPIPYTVKTGVLQLHCIERSQCREKLTLQPGNHDTARSVNDITLISVLVTLSVA